MKCKRFWILSNDRFDIILFNKDKDHVSSSGEYVFKYIQVFINLLYSPLTHGNNLNSRFISVHKTTYTPPPHIESACTKPRKWGQVYECWGYQVCLCIYDLLIRFWNCSDSGRIYCFSFYSNKFCFEYGCI